MTKEQKHINAIYGLHQAIRGKGFSKEDTKTIVKGLVREAGEFALTRLYTSQIIDLHTKVNGTKDLKVYLTNETN